jgi:hypothetical protein
MLLNHKKCDTTEVENYRPINLLSPLYKIFTRIINHRIGKNKDSGSGFGTNNYLLTAKVLIEKTIEYNRLLVLVFVDFQKTIDTVEISSILAALSQCRIDYEYARLIRNMYKNWMAYTRRHKDSDTFPIE